MDEDDDSDAAELANALLMSVGLSPMLAPSKHGSDAPVTRRAEVPVEVAFAKLVPVDRQQAARSADRAMRLLGASPEEFPSKMTEFLSKQYGVPAINLAAFDVIPDVLGLLPEAVVRAHAVMPVNVAGGVLIVATLDPSNEYLLDAVASFTGLDVEPVVALLTDIDAAIARYFG